MTSQAYDIKINHLNINIVQSYIAISNILYFIMCIHMYIRTYIRTCTCMCIHIYVCTYVYTTES